MQELQANLEAIFREDYDGGYKNCKLGRNFFVMNLVVGAKQQTWKPVFW